MMKWKKKKQRKKFNKNNIFNEVCLLIYLLYDRHWYAKIKCQ